MKQLVAATLSAVAWQFPSAVIAQGGPAEMPVFDGIPDRFLAKMEVRNANLRSATRATIRGRPFDYVLSETLLWSPGQVLRVAFRGGEVTLHKEIAEAAAEWTKFGNIKFDFGLDAASGRYRTWSGGDAQYAAEIRISFDQDGYWSAIGTDATNGVIFAPYEASMNFGGFHQGKPSNWQSVVLHEFGHALGFEHEHQSPEGGCERDFLWENEAGYVPTTSRPDQYVPDVKGRRPGLYTVLGGYPNFWPRSKTDSNLRQLRRSSAYRSPTFDPRSIMKYYFPDWMFVERKRSHCFSEDNRALSDGDRKGIASAYPFDASQASRVLAARTQYLQALANTSGVLPSTTARLEVLIKSTAANQSRLEVIER